MAMGSCPNNNKEFITGSSDAKLCKIKLCLNNEIWDIESNEVLKLSKPGK
jgi:hypothetical protein